MSFKKNKFIIIKNAISKELANFIYNYFLLKRNVAKKLFENRIIPPNETMWGTWEDTQVINTYL